MSFFSTNIRILREMLNIKQDAFEQIGIKKGTYSNYEIGKTEPNIETLIKISKFLRIDLTALICTDLSVQGNLASLKNANAEEENAHLNAHPNAHLTQKLDNNCNPNCTLSPNSENSSQHLSMYKESEAGEKQPRQDNSSNELIKHLIEQLKEQSEEIGALRQEVLFLKDRLAQNAEDALNVQGARA